MDKDFSINVFKFSFFIAFIDPALFTINRLLRYNNVIDTSFDNYFILDFSFANYILLILCCFVVFLLTFFFSIKAPKNFLKINISKNTFYLLLIILFIISIYVFSVQLTYRPRYAPGSIKTLSGLLNIFGRILAVCLFIIYQLNRTHLNYKVFLIILVSNVLMSDNLAGTAHFISYVLFEFFRYNFKKKLFLIIFYGILSIFVLEFTLGYTYTFNPENTDINFFTFEYLKYKDQFINSFIPRAALHAEQLYSYLGGYLDISNYFYLLNIIIESFNNRLKIIFDYGEIFYPKTVAQSIVYNIQGLDAPGGSSPGYVLSVISFLPFTIPFVVIIAFLFKQVSFRINEQLNFIQIASFCWIIKMVSANFLDMFAIIEPYLIGLLLVYLSSHVYLKQKEV
ncbi:hypothetical protein OA180_01835 [Candidatus Pelagibacter sp.]|nr:hypothetical protein [Candidatus Pelagibacter sp.]